MRQENERVERLEQAISDAVPEWSLAEVVTALQAMRGIDLVAAVTVPGRDRRSPAGIVYSEPTRMAPRSFQLIQRFSWLALQAQ